MSSRTDRHGCGTRLIRLALLLAGTALGCGRVAEPPDTAAGSAALSRETLGGATLAEAPVLAPRSSASLLSRLPPEDPKREPEPGKTSEPEPPDEVLEPGPAQKLWLAPATEVLEPDPDLTARLTAAAFKRRDERRLQIFTHPSTIGAVWGTVVSAESEVFDSKEDPAGFIATRYQVKPQRSWKTPLTDLVAVWVPGGQRAAVGKSEGPPPDSNDASQALFSVGDQVLLSLRQVPLIDGAEPRLVVFGGSTGALVAAAPESKTDSPTDSAALEVFAKSLDQRLLGY